MIVQCPSCGRKYRMDDRYREQPDLTVSCPNCRTKFHVADSPAPKPAGAVPPPAEAAAPSPAPPSAGASAPPASPEPVSGSSGKIILVADDSPFFRTMVGDILVQAGYRVAFAIDGEETLAKVREVEPALILLDLNLPKISGFDVIRHIRHGHIRRDVPILVISAVFTDTSHLLTLESLGANEFIDKNFKPNYLLGKIRRLLGTD